MEIARSRKPAMTTTPTIKISTGRFRRLPTGLAFPTPDIEALRFQMGDMLRHIV